MKIYLLAILFFTALLLPAQTIFYKVFSFSNQVDIGCVQRTNDGGYIITAGGPGNQQYVVKTDSVGDTLWTKLYSSMWGWSYVIQTNDGGYMFSNKDGIIKTNSVGNISWAKQTVSYHGPVIIRQTNDGGYIMTGGYFSCYLGKLDASGNFSWNKFYQIYGANGHGSTDDVRQTSDGGYIIAGYTSTYGAGNSDFCLTKTDNDGNLLWSKTYGGAGHDQSESVQQTSDGGYILSGRTNSFGVGGEDVYVVRTDSAGNLLWSKTYGGSQTDDGYTIQQTFDGGYLICGPSLSFAGGAINKVCLIKTDSAGAVVWSYAYIYNANVDQATALQTADGGYIVGSSSGGFPGGLILMKIDSAGNSYCYQYPAAIVDVIPATQVTSAIDTVYNIPDTMINLAVTEASGALIYYQCSTNISEQKLPGNIKVYPNPLVNNFTIDLGKDNTIQHVIICDTEGRIVKSVFISENNVSVNHVSEINVDINDLHGGIYILDLASKNGSEKIKIVKY